MNGLSVRFRSVGLQTPKPQKTSSDNNKKKMINLLTFANEITKNDGESIFTLIHMIGLKLASRAICDVFLCDDHDIKKWIGFYDSIKWSQGFHEIPHETKSERAWVLDLANDIVLPKPWDKTRAMNSIINIGDGKPWGKWEQDSINHKVHLVYPIGIGIVCGGNHSIMAGMARHDGMIAGSQIIDIRPFISKYASDGEVFIDNSTGETIGIVNEFEFAALVELGRIVTQLGLEPPQIMNT